MNIPVHQNVLSVSSVAAGPCRFVCRGPGDGTNRMVYSKCGSQRWAAIKGSTGSPEVHYQYVREGSLDENPRRKALGAGEGSRAATEKEVGKMKCGVVPGGSCPVAQPAFCGIPMIL